MLDFLNAISAGAKIAGGLLSHKGARTQANAYANQATFQLQFGEEQARLAEEMAELEAALLEAQGSTAQEIAAFNAEIARRNAEWERRSGEILLGQARKAGEARLSRISAALASQGRLVSGPTSDALLAESLAELEKDLATIALTTQSRVSQQRQQASLFTLQGTRSAEFARQQAAGRRRAGEIEAEGLLRSAELNASGASASARTAKLGGRTSLLDAFTGAANSLFG